MMWENADYMMLKQRRWDTKLNKEYADNAVPHYIYSKETLKE